MAVPIHHFQGMLRLCDKGLGVMVLDSNGYLLFSIRQSYQTIYRELPIQEPVYKPCTP